MSAHRTIGFMNTALAHIVSLLIIVVIIIHPNPGR
jgi:hypothetical protein